MRGRELRPPRGPIPDAREVVDVLVVGAGPAGSLTALLAARRGIRTLVVERAAFPRWKVCGATLNRAAQEVLRGVGLADIPASGVPLGGMLLSGWGRHATVAVDGSVALRRSVMDQSLLDAAAAAGARVVEGSIPDLGTLHEVSGYRELTLRRGGDTRSVRARVVVVAAGLAGPREGGRGADVSPDSRIGVGAAFLPEASKGRGSRGLEPVGAYPAGVIHMIAGDAGYVGLVRTEDGGLNVAGALDPDFVRECGGPGAAVAVHLMRAGAPSLPDGLHHGWRGTPGLTRRAGQLAGPRFFRVGDSAGYVEPFTGEGMAWALAGARDVAPLVAEGVQGWSPGLERQWARRFARSIGSRQRVCQGIAWLSRHPGWARAALGAVGRVPWLAAPLAARTTRSFRPPGGEAPLVSHTGHAP